jgi:hypothetical protein
LQAIDVATLARIVEFAYTHGGRVREHAHVV